MMEMKKKDLEEEELNKGIIITMMKKLIMMMKKNSKILKNQEVSFIINKYLFKIFLTYSKQMEKQQEKE